MTSSEMLLVWIAIALTADVLARLVISLQVSMHHADWMSLERIRAERRVADLTWRISAEKPKKKSPQKRKS